MFIVSVLITVILSRILHLVTRMATLGKIGEFKRSVEEYAECLEFSFAANGITTAKKKCATFLALIGPTTYKLLCSMLAPNKPGKVAFNEMVKVLSDHYSPKSSEIVSHFKFYYSSRKPGESVSMFISEVRHLVRFCNFGDSLDAMIRDPLVCGNTDKQIQKHLLSQGDKLMLAKAMRPAQAIETATKDAQLIQPQNASIWTVQDNLPQQGNPQKKPYYCCTK